MTPRRRTQYHNDLIDAIYPFEYKVHRTDVTVRLVNAPPTPDSYGVINPKKLVVTTFGDGRCFATLSGPTNQVRFYREVRFAVEGYEKGAKLPAWLEPVVAEARKK